MTYFVSSGTLNLNSVSRQEVRYTAAVAFDRTPPRRVTTPRYMYAMLIEAEIIAPRSTSNSNQ